VNGDAAALVVQCERIDGAEVLDDSRKHCGIEDSIPLRPV
jgi:hypothetical protein